jgi:hypothetical protein
VRELTGKTAFVTGAASGIGLATDIDASLSFWHFYQGHQMEPARRRDRHRRGGQYHLAEPSRFPRQRWPRSADRRQAT